jgi:hypothetical protein
MLYCLFALHHMQDLTAQQKHSSTAFLSVQTSPEDEEGMLLLLSTGCLT